MSEQGIAKELSDQAKEIEKMGDVVLRAAEGRRPMPISLGDSLKRIAALIALCEEGLADHIDGGLDKESLGAVAAALSAVHMGIDSLTVFQALEGRAYDTMTVAND